MYHRQNLFKINCHLIHFNFSSIYEAETTLSFISTASIRHFIFLSGCWEYTSFTARNILVYSYSSWLFCQKDICLLEACSSQWPVFTLFKLMQLLSILLPVTRLDMDITSHANHNHIIPTRTACDALIRSVAPVCCSQLHRHDHHHSVYCFFCVILKGMFLVTLKMK
jgi:hypothetical protein